RQAMALNDGASLDEALGVAEQPGDRFFFSRLEPERNLDGAARIQGRTDAIRERFALESGRPRQRAVASDELRAIAGHRAAVARPEIENRYALGEILTEAIVCQQSSADVIA